MPLPQIWKYVAQFHQPHCNRARFVKHTVKLQQPQIVSATLEASAFQSRALQWANLPQRVTGRQVYLRNSSTKFARKVGSMIHRHDSFKKIRVGNPHGKILYISTNLSFANYEFDGFRRISTDFDGFRRISTNLAGRGGRRNNPSGKSPWEDFVHKYKFILRKLRIRRISTSLAGRAGQRKIRTEHKFP